MKKSLVALAALLVGGAVMADAASLPGTVEGVVSVSGRPVRGLSLTLVDMNSGSVHQATTGDGGSFALQLAPGDYLVTTGGRGGLAVGTGPASIRVESGRVASANLNLIALPVAAALLAQEGPGGIQHDTIDCIVEKQKYPLIDAIIEPKDRVAKARVFFKSALSDEWFYVEMTLDENGLWIGKLPPPTVEASPISYYIQVTYTDFTTEQTPEVDARVIAEDDECEGRVAPLGAGGAAPIFTAAGAAVGVPGGFVAGGLGAGAIIGGAAGLTALGFGAGALGTDSTPTPTPAPTGTPPPTPTPTPPPGPTPTPTPEPEPEPTPTPTPTPTPVPTPPPGSDPEPTFK